MKFTIAELKLADELAFPEDMEILCKKYFPDTDEMIGIWHIYYWDFIHKHERSLLRLIFHYSRSDYKNGLGPVFEGMVSDLLTGNYSSQEISPQTS